MSAPCSVCAGKKNANKHLKGHPDYAHPYMDASPVGIQPMSAGMREFRKSSGYDADVKAARGNPCQIVSPVCTGKAEHLHEPLSRGRAGGLKAALRDGPEPIPCCDACNGYVSENPVWAKEHNFLVSRKGSR